MGAPGGRVNMPVLASVEETPAPEGPWAIKKKQKKKKKKKKKKNTRHVRRILGGEKTNEDAQETLNEGGQ